MRKPLIIAAVAGSAAVVTIGAISIRGNSQQSVDTVSNAVQAAPDSRPAVVERPSRLDSDEPMVAPERPEETEEVRRGPGRGGRDGGEGRPDWRRRPGLNDAPMAAEDWADRYAEMRKRRDDFMARYDLDGDGELSEEEREVMREQFRAERRERMIERMTDRFDADGDGVLNEDERLAAEAELEARDIERRTRMVERFDTDGDGQLSDAESQAAREQFSRGRGGGPGGGPGGYQQIVQRYDRDGDGDLNLDESYEAYLDQFDRRTQREFARRYDANGDGGVDTSDFSVFLEKYNAKDESADVTGDGKIDDRDVERFRDLMLVSE